MMAKKVIQENVGRQKVVIGDLRQRKMTEVKGADHRLVRRVFQEVDSCPKVVMVGMHEMAGILEKVMMAAKVEMAD